MPPCSYASDKCISPPSATAFRRLADRGLSVSPSECLRRLVEQIEYADQIGLDIFGVGEHHRRERNTQEAVDDFYPGYVHTMTEIGKEHGWPKMTRASFGSQRGPQGALLVGDPDEVIEKIVRHRKALSGISRITFMMNPASLPHAKLMSATEIIGTRIAPALREVDKNYIEVL
jgi:alkanesulfonate monooxygenase SsuD/methylene tetrahydromethanopterin reductase-like flavin-dependent oxidoreductase (luciferase family)